MKLLRLALKTFALAALFIVGALLGLVLNVLIAG